MATEVVLAKKKSVTIDMADRYGMEVDAFEKTLRSTVFPAAGTAGEFAAFLLVCKEYDLNPITKEIYAFPKQGGGIVPIVSVDGWMKLVNSHPAFDGMDFIEREDDGKLISITCTIYRKDRAHPITITEYYDECRRDTGPWKMKHRMLRHKSAIQCARYAFGFAGIYDEDEGEKIALAPTVASYGPPADPPPPEIEHKPQIDIAAEAKRMADEVMSTAAITSEGVARLPEMPPKRKRATKAEMEERRAAAAAPPIETAMEQIKEGVEANLPPPPDDDIPMPPDEPPPMPEIPTHIQSAVAKWKTVIKNAETEAELDSAWDTHLSAVQGQMPEWVYAECINLDDERRGEIG